MCVRTSVAAENKNTNWRLLRSLFVVSVLSLPACTPRIETDPLVEFSTELRVDGTRSPSLSRQLREGTYLIEVRERDIDLRTRIDTGDHRVELADAHLRHGVHRTVVSLAGPAAVRVTLDSVDQRNWRGAAAVRILRWPARATDSPPDQRLSGLVALGDANALLAKSDDISWRAAISSLRQAAVHFAAANDMQALAESEYERSAVELNLLHDHADGRRTAESAQGHFAEADDPAGEARASVLRALGEFRLASRMGLNVPQADQRALLDAAVLRLQQAQHYFEANEMHTDAIAALLGTSLREQVGGDFERAAPIYRSVLKRARERSDTIFAVQAAQKLASIEASLGHTAQAVAMLGELLPLIDRDRNPGLYASLASDLGAALLARGDFDRALLLHTEALELYSTLGDEGARARELAALALIRFRSGNTERALISIESALSLLERAGDQADLVSALRLAGNAAARQGKHDTALDYLRRAELEDSNGATLGQTRVLIAGELRELGNLRGAERLLLRVLPTKNEPTRAHALTERAYLRELQRRDAEALADLQEADAIYARLGLDFERIESSSALAGALLAAGDVQSASRAADVAVAAESRIRAGSMNPELRARFLSASYAPYEARIEVDLAHAARRDTASVWRAFKVAEAIRGRSLADRLAQVRTSDRTPRDVETDRLRERLNALQLTHQHQMLNARTDDADLLETRRSIDELAARLEARVLRRPDAGPRNGARIDETLEAVQGALPADTAVLAYFVGDRRSHAWLLTRSSLRHGVLPGRRDIGDLVTAFVQRQRDGAKPQADARINALLGNLLEGVNARRLLVLPDGPLNGLPFAALPLPQGRARELLVDRFVVSTAPSLALALQPPLSTAARRRVAVVSDPIYTPDDRRLTLAASGAANYRGSVGATERLARLPYSAIEARAVVRAFGGADVIELAGFNATARRVIDLPSADLDVLHFATHAVARPDAPEQSALLLSEFAPDGSALANDRLTVDDIGRSGLRADVVVLSGCETGDGRELRGEGVLGLAYGFLANGSHTVIASLWPVEDALTARFMEEFYAAYRYSGNAPQALRIAQLRARGTSGPAVWSSFVVRANQLP